ncbi:AP-3 complex subunit beta [Coemansia sp. RSA 1722]|nr:AP-3 complex subunit beta [Coemansia sp. RSA 485]KAJ2601303.1 AP-3 complex subunit beta [Coemansia sp. RSA 1722]
MAEYLSKAMALAQDAAKLSLRFSEGLMDNALEFGLDTPGGFYDNAEFKLSQVRKELGSGTEKEKITGMKRLLAAVAKGHDASEYFADVVKNVASGNLEMRRLVYMYLLRYAEQEPDLALLSVNTFQRDLTDSNQVIRAMALRVMSSIRVPVISPIVMLAIRKLAEDPSPHVRKTAALAVPKLLRLDVSLRAELETVVERMLAENSPLAIGSVIQAFRAVCPIKYSMVHVHFRRWCLMMAQLDEWGQVELVKLLIAYARTQFIDPEKSTLDPDHKLLLRCIHPLLQSRNSAVVMTAVSAYFHLASGEQMTVIAKPLVRLMRASRETSFVALTNILKIAQLRPGIFYPHVQSFFVAASDPPMTRRLKLQVLALLVDQGTVGLLVPEIANYTRSAQTDISVGAIRVMLACARRLSNASVDCFQSLLLLLQSDTREEVANAAMQAVRVLLLDGSVRDSQDRRNMTLYDILCYLTSLLDRCKADIARAHIFALITDFAKTKFGCLHSLDVLRAAARGFKEEGTISKMQVLELSAELVMLMGDTNVGEAKKDAERISMALADNRQLLLDIHAYVFTLARYDIGFEVRDRARTLRALCPLPGDEAHSADMPNVLEIAHELLLHDTDAGGPDVAIQDPGHRDSASMGRFTVGSLSLTMNQRIKGYSGLADWPEIQPKDADRGMPVGSNSSGGVDSSGRGIGGISSRAITIAGISGRVQPRSPAGAEYATPKSAADDLDAFLNSEDDSVLHARSLVHAPQVIYRQRSISSDSSSVTSSSSDSDDEEVSGSEDSDESDDEESADGSNKAGNAHCDEESDVSSESSDDERNPFIPQSNYHSSSKQHDDSEHSDTDNARPLIEGTSKYWQ